MQHFEREVGSSNYTFKKLVKLWSNIIGFSIVPLQMAIYTGFVFSVLGILGALAVVIIKIVRPWTYMGWPSTMAAICFFSGINLLFMGMVGEYVGRIFQGMSRNPQYVVRSIHTHDGSVPGAQDAQGELEAAAELFAPEKSACRASAGKEKHEAAETKPEKEST